MLKELTIKNFRSFKEEVIFSMEADNDRVSEHLDHIIDICNNKILKVASMYGPNGGGKTNLIMALSLLNAIVTHDDDETFNPKSIKCAFSDNEEVEFTTFFIVDEYEIGLKLIFETEIEDFLYFTKSEKLIDYINNINIVYESVVYRMKDEFDYNLLYERDNKGILSSELLKSIDVRLPNLAKSKTVLSKIYDEYANTDYVTSIYIDIIKKLYNEVNFIVNLNIDFHIPFQKKIVLEYREKLIELLNNVDIKISNINVYENKPDTIYFEREININNKKIIRELPLFDESIGTKKIFKIFLAILFFKDKNAIFYFDDMNSFLHPKLFKAVVQYFNSMENKTCQLIFNSHDILNMTNELFRRDEIWFVYRDENYSSKILPLSNIVNYKGEQVRKDAKFYKQYIEGRYGADPFIKKGLGWYEGS